MPFHIASKNAVTTVHTALIRSHAFLKKSTTAPIYFSTVAFISFHKPFQKFLNFSDLFQRTTKAATSAAIAVTTKPIGFAAIAAFNNHVLAAATTSAALIPASAVVTAVIMPVIFHAAKAVAIPTTPASISGKLSINHCIPASTFGANLSSVFVTASIAFSICGLYFSKKLFTSSAAVVFMF